MIRLIRNVEWKIFPHIENACPEKSQTEGQEVAEVGRKWSEEAGTLTRKKHLVEDTPQPWGEKLVIHPHTHTYEE
jgi:hypothetical protein